MSDGPEAIIHCAHLNGSDGFSCDVIGSYTLDRNKPTQARIADGPVERFQGRISMPHLRCIPAEEAFAHKGGIHEIPYAEIVRQQACCSHYEQIDAGLMVEVLKEKTREAGLEGI